VLLFKEPLFFARKGELEDLALSGRIPKKCARRSQRFTFIYDFERLYKNAWEIWETARNRAQWEKVTVHGGLDQPWYRKREIFCTPAI